MVQLVLVRNAPTDVTVTTNTDRCFDRKTMRFVILSTFNTYIDSTTVCIQFSLWSQDPMTQILSITHRKHSLFVFPGEMHGDIHWKCTSGTVLYLPDGRGPDSCAQKSRPRHRTPKRRPCTLISHR